MIAITLMIVGIGVISIFTATVASLFSEEHHSKTEELLMARINGLEEKIDRLLKAGHL